MTEEGNEDPGPEAEEVNEPEEAEEEEKEEELRLGSSELEKFVKTLQSAPSKFNALRDEVVHVAEMLHKKLSAVDTAETADAEMENELTYMSDELNEIEKQRKELPPEVDRAYRGTKQRREAIDRLAKEFIAVRDFKRNGA